MKIEEFISRVEKIFPPETAMPGDKIGLQLQSNNSDVQRIMIAFEVTPGVIAEAVSTQADMLLTFHPLIYSSLAQITNNDRVGNLVTQLIQNKISLYVVHTNFDSYKYGTNKLLAESLGLKVESFLLPDKVYPECGMGVIASADTPLSAAEILDSVNRICNSPIKYNSLTQDKLFSRIAIVGGSGFSFLPEVLSNKCDAFITADCSYHKFHEIFDTLLLIDPGHFEMEQFVAKGMYGAIKYKFGDEIGIVISGVDTNPVRYY